MLRFVRGVIVGVVGLMVAAVVVLVVAGDSTAGKGVALLLFGIGCVVAVSAVFWVVGRSEDAERAAAAAPEAPEPADGEDPHPRPALDRRRPMPPRRPS
jgi:hypothetical protein